MADPQAVLDEIADKSVIVFDGECVLCSAFFRFVLRHDRREAFHFMIAQSPKGEALYAHFGLKPADYETNLVLRRGALHQKMDAFAAVMAELGWPWRPLAVARHLPRPVGGWLYDRIARNRYRLFGRRKTCLIPEPEIAARFIG